MTERHIPRRVRILGEITMVVAGIATAATGGYIIHQEAENDNKVVAGSIVMLAGGTITMLAGGMLTREEPDPTLDNKN